jgi:lysyl-tRNA synthetase class 1
MALEITEQVEIAFQDADKADQRLDEFLVRDRMVRILHDLGEFTQEQRRGNFALISALEFQPRRMYGEPIWDMYWQPLSSATDTSGKDHFFPDVSIVDADTMDQWCFRGRTTRHPLLRARYADLAWEVTRYRKDLARRPDVAIARSAIDGYLDAVEGTLFVDDIYAWNYVERAISGMRFGGSTRSHGARRACSA